MGANVSAMKVVLDTNTAVSATLFPLGRLAWMRHRWTIGDIVPLVCPATARELIRVLGYPKFKLDEDDIRAVLAAYLPFTETVADDPTSNLPRCSDPDDQIFLDLALAGHAEVLVTGDGALLDMKGQVPFAIETSAEFKTRFP
jgi:uncharacterized protein